jgi:hypothetical protein
LLFYCDYYNLLLLLLPFTVVIFAAVVDIAATAAAFAAVVVGVSGYIIIFDIALLPSNTLSMLTCNFRILFALVIVREVTPGHSPRMSSLRSL